MTKKNEDIVNERAKPGSGTKHDKHAPKSKEAIAEAAENAAAQTESDKE